MASADVAAFVVTRASAPGGPFLAIDTIWPAPSRYLDESAPVGADSYYQVYAVDAFGNAGPAGAAVSAKAMADTDSAYRTYGITIDPANWKLINEKVLVDPKFTVPAKFTYRRYHVRRGGALPRRQLAPLLEEELEGQVCELEGVPGAHVAELEGPLPRLQPRAGAHGARAVRIDRPSDLEPPIGAFGGERPRLRPLRRDRAGRRSIPQIPRIPLGGQHLQSWEQSIHAPQSRRLRDLLRQGNEHRDRLRRSRVADRAHQSCAGGGVRAGAPRHARCRRLPRILGNDRLARRRRYHRWK